MKNYNQIDKSAQVISIDRSFDSDDFDADAWEAKHGRPHTGSLFLTKLINDIKAKAETGHLPLDSKIDNPQWPDKSGENGAPINTWQNLQWMMNQYGVKARYNVVAQRVSQGVSGRPCP
ncbi:hypothetical protein ACRS8P_09930 [Burkholderia cenocepacia]